MRKINILMFMSLDGVVQAPGGPEEDTSGGFKYGGWTVPYADESSGALMNQQMKEPFDLLLGKKTYDIFASYWPKQSADNEIALRLNKAHKYVATHNPFEPLWKETTVLTGDVVGQIKKIKSEDGPDLQVYGSANFCQTLLQNDLVDNLWLKIYPVTLGSGKKLFAEGTIPAAFTLTQSNITKSGVIFADYARAGEVQTGSFV
jgi:dihydrofolate reductase